MDINQTKIVEDPSWFDNLIILLAIVLPGFMYLYLNDKPLFIEIDVIKLILLSIFYSFPSFVIFFFTINNTFFGKEFRRSAERVVALENKIKTWEKKTDRVLKKHDQFEFELNNNADSLSPAEYSSKREILNSTREKLEDMKDSMFWDKRDLKSLSYLKNPQYQVVKYSAYLTLTSLFLTCYAFWTTDSIDFLMNLYLWKAMPSILVILIGETYYNAVAFFSFVSREK